MEYDSIHHLAIEVKEVSRAIAWYRSHFNCEVVYQDATWALLRFANIHLALVIPEQHPAHIAFVHDHAEQLGTLKSHRDGTRSVYLEDSEGNTIEMLERASLKN